MLPLFWFLDRWSLLHFIKLYYHEKLFLMNVENTCPFQFYDLELSFQKAFRNPKSSALFYKVKTPIANKIICISTIELINERFFFNCRFIRLKEIASFSKELWLISKLNIPSRVYFNLSLRKMHHYENRISLTQLTARFFLQFVESNKYIKYQGMPLWNGARFSKYPAGIVTQETTSKFKCMTNYCNE